MASSAIDGSAASSADAPSSHAAEPPPAAPSRGVTTQLQQGVRHPKIYKDGTVPYGMLVSAGELTSLDEALDDAKWLKAMEEEYDALLQNKTWYLVSPSNKKNIIDCKWYIALRNVLMVQLIGTKLAWWQRVLNSVMA